MTSDPARTLLLLRHAKSSWTDPNLPDHERPLASRGTDAARRMAEYLKSAGLVPDLVLCSSARRAQQTAELVDAVLGGSMRILVERDLYGANADDLMARIRQVDEGVATLMVIGHNPTMAELARMLAGDGNRAAMAQLAEKYPTAALAVLSVKGWADLEWSGGYLSHLVVPRSLA